MKALKIEDFNSKQLKIQLSFFIRLVRNEYSRKFMINLVKANKRGFAKNSLIGELFNETKAKSLNEMYRICKIKIKTLDLNTKRAFENEEEVTELRELLNRLEINRLEIFERIRAF